MFNYNQKKGFFKFDCIEEGVHEFIVRQALERVSKSNNKQIELHLETSGKLIRDFLTSHSNSMWKIESFWRSANCYELYNGQNKRIDFLNKIVKGVVKNGYYNRKLISYIRNYI